MARRLLNPASPAVRYALPVWGVAILLVGCSPGPDRSNCQPPCEATHRCDTKANRCRPKKLQKFGVDEPGRALAATRMGQEGYVSAIHPEERLVVAGRATGDPALRTLGQLPGDAPVATAIDANEQASRIAVVWVGADNAFRMARRTEGTWSASRRVTTDSDYAAAGVFDVAIDVDGRPHIVFRDSGTKNLRYLTSTSEDGWTIQTVDDGTAVKNRSDCAPGGADPERPGVGWEPDVEFLSAGLGASLQVSYYDGDCGDLRLAERTDSNWSVQVVDTGTFSLRGDSVRRGGNAGRFSGLSARPNGEVAIAYQDVQRGQLAFASESNRDFGTALVDPGLHVDDFSRRRKHLVGAFADLAFDSDGTPYIAYMNGSTARLHLAWRATDQAGNRRWVHRMFGGGPPTGFHAQIVLFDGKATLFAERLAHQGGSYRSRLFRTSVDLR